MHRYGTRGHLGLFWGKIERGAFSFRFRFFFLRAFTGSKLGMRRELKLKEYRKSSIWEKRTRSRWTGACNSIIFLSGHGVYFIWNFPAMQLPWECHDQSQETNWRHSVTGPELSFFHKRKDMLKIDQCKKCRDIDLVWEMHTHRLLEEIKTKFAVESSRRIWKQG